MNNTQFIHLLFLIGTASYKQNN